MVAKRVLAAALAAALLTAMLGGCAEKTADDSGQDAGSTTGSTAPAGEWAKTLPTEPGYAWDIATYPGTDPIPVSLTVAGPWTLTAGDDWPLTTTEIVDPADVSGIDRFADYTYVVKAMEGTTEVYFPRQVTDEYLLQLGKITGSGSGATVESYEKPLRFWPVDFAVGDTFVVQDTGSFGINATVLAKNAVTVPAGTIDEAYLVRFDYTPLAEGALEGTFYYILSPEVGFVALFGVAEGDEASGFTALESLQLLVTMPEKR